jgi:hypothetical protein
VILRALDTVDQRPVERGSVFGKELNGSDHVVLLDRG